MIEIVMPKWGLTMEDGTVTRFMKKTGEPIEKGEVLCEIETDKVTQELEAEGSGVLAVWVINEGDEVACGEVIAQIATTEEWEAIGAGA